MIGIEIDGEFLELANNAKLRIKMPSLVFTRAFVAQGYSYPVSAPMTPHNARLLNFKNRIASTEEWGAMRCWIWLAGRRWRAADINYRGTKDNAFDLDLSVPEHDSIRRLREVSTEDLDNEYPITVDVSDGPDEVNMHIYPVNGSLSQTDIVLGPMLNEGIHRAEPYDVYLGGDAQNDSIYLKDYPYLNHFDGTRDQAWLFHKQSEWPGLDNVAIKFTALPYLAKVMDHLMDLVGMRLSGDLRDDPFFKRQVVLNNDLRYGPLAWDESVIIPIGAEAVGWNTLFTPFRLGDLLPSMTGLELLLKVMQRYNATPFFDAQSNMRLRTFNSIMAATDALDWTEYLVPSRQLEHTVLTSIEVNAAKESLDDALEEPEELVPAPYGTVLRQADLPSDAPTTRRYVVLEDNGLYEASRVLPGGAAIWTRIGDNATPGEGDEDAEFVECGVAFTAMHRGADELTAGRDWLVPKLNMPMRISNNATGFLKPPGNENVKELRLLNFQGMQADSNGDLYPLLSVDRYDYAGDDVGGFREMVDQPNGIKEQHYATYERVLKHGRSVKRRLRLPAHHALNYPWDRKIMLEGITYLTREVDVEFNANGIGLANVELQRLPPMAAPDRQLRGRGDRVEGFETLAFSGPVYALIETSDGKVMVGGNFFNTGAYRLCRLLYTGTLDTGFDCGTELDGGVLAIAEQTDGKIVVGGGFTGRVKRFNPDGSVDSGFSSGMTTGTGVNKIVLMSDGRMVIGGDFTGTGTNYICRLNADGSLDGTFDAGTLLSATVYDLGIRSNGKIVVAGAFSTGTRPWLCQLNDDGTLDSAFDATATLSGPCHRVLILPDGKLVLTKAGAWGMAMLETDGSAYGGFTLSDTLFPSFCLARDADGGLITGIATIMPHRQNIARYSSQGDLDKKFGVHAWLRGDAFVIMIDRRGDIWCGGTFYRSNSFSADEFLVKLSGGVRCA